MRWIKRKDINDEAWNRCIDTSINPKIYGLTWWLDAVCDEWEGLVVNDYDAVVPVPIKNYWLFKKVFQPPFTQQLGLFTSQLNSHEWCIEAMNAIRKRFGHGTLQWNEGQLDLIHATEIFYKRTNYVQHLEERTVGDYRKSHQRNLKKAVDCGCEMREVTLIDFLAFFKKHTPVYQSDFKKHKDKWETLLETALARGKAKVLGAYVGAELMATVFWGHYDGRMYYLFPAVSPEGKKKGANIFMVHHAPAQFEDALIIDFEGSEIEGIAHFMLGFNAQLHPYPVMKW